MNKLFNPSVSIEEMAAFLDGNLTPRKMQEVADVIRCDDNLSQLMSANSSIDNAITEYSDLDLELPKELQSFDFDIPIISDSSSELIIQSQELQTDDALIASCIDDSLNQIDANQSVLLNDNLNLDSVNNLDEDSSDSLDCDHYQDSLSDN